MIRGGPGDDQSTPMSVVTDTVAPMTDTFAPYNPADLPAAVLAYLEARDDGDHDDAVDTFAPGARVQDDGRTYDGLDAITAWIEQSSSEYTYTVTRTGQRVGTDGDVVLQVRLDGTFPGGTVTLRYQFQLEEDLISRLVIEV